MIKLSCEIAQKKKKRRSGLIKLATILIYGVTLGLGQTVDVSDTMTTYEISSYFGSREQDFDIKGFAISSNYSSFNWAHGVDVDDADIANPIFYVIDTTELNIKKMTNNGVVTVLASTAGGYRDGDISNSLFNSSSSIAFFRQNKYLAARARYKQIIVLKDDSAQCKSQAQNCQDTTLTNNSKINLLRLFEYYDIPAEVNQNMPNQNDHLNEVLIVADTDNHCIRKIDLVTNIVTTVAGKCTVSGCLDGPIGTNLLMAPTSLGVDEQGIIFFYDGGVDYIRMVDPVTTFVSTLIKGSCREDLRFQPKNIKQSLSNKRVICYKNWLNINATPANHKYEEDLLSICQLQQSLCSTVTSSNNAT